MTTTFPAPVDLTGTDPTYTTPTGPVWLADGADILDTDAFDSDALEGENDEGAGIDKHRYLVRRLPNARSMLRVAPLLGRVTRFDHPRMWGPSFWTRGDDGVWIATVQPRGVRLSAADLGRLSWAEALECWRPLARAVSRLHGRGMVHGTLAPWNVAIGGADTTLTAIDAGCWVGEDFEDIGTPRRRWLAPEMCGSVEARQPSPAADVYGLARLLLRLTLSVDQAGVSRAGAERPNLTGVPGYAIPAIDAALSDEATARPARVADLVEATVPGAGAEPSNADEPDGADTVSVMYARVSDIERLDHPKFGEGIKFYVNRQSDGADAAQTDAAQTDAAKTGAAKTGAFFYKQNAPDVYESVKWVWEGCELNLIDARVVQNSAGARFLTSRDDTLPVLEPHMPMSVSNVLKAEGCPSRFLVDQRNWGGSSRPLVFGNLVHGLLDDLVEASPPDFNQAFAARVQDLRIDMLAAGLRDADLGELRDDARRHFDNMERFTARRRSDSAQHDRVGWTGRNVEVTRYSTRYGIEGRIDLVAEDEREGLQIVELKSGSTWDGHLSQLRFYTFLWEGLAQKRGLEVTGHVMYSRHGRMKHAPMEDTERERRILRARNELIACMRSFVDPSYTYRTPYHMLEPSACRAAACNFRRGRCQRQTAVLGLADQASPFDAASREPWADSDPEIIARGWAWQRHFGRLIEMERWASTAKLGRVLHAGRLDERKRDWAAADGLELAEAHPASGYVEFRGDHGQLFRPGDYLVAHRGDFNTSHILRGRVVEVDADRLTLSTRAAAIAAELSRGDWILDKLPARLGFRQAHHAVYGALDRQGEARLEVLFRPDSKRARSLMSDPDPRWEPDDATSQLNPSQRQAVERAATAPAGALIQGPPGTGKTTVIAHAVRELVARGNKVVVSAFTNTAVDTILGKLLDIGFDDFVRIGPSARSPQLAERLAADGHGPKTHFSDDMAAELVSLDVLADDLLAANVVASTTHRCVSSSVMEFLGDERGQPPFDVAIVDEAAQITEPMTLAAINLGARFVLVGDHRQLPPIVQNERAHSNFVDGTDLPVDADRLTRSTPAAATADMRSMDLSAAATGFEWPDELDALGCGGLDRSLFERLVAQLPHVMLDEQYRMHADIMAFSNEAFYGGQLRAHDAVGGRQLAVDPAALDDFDPVVAGLLNPAHPLVFANVDHDGRGRQNEPEARALVDTAAALLAAAPSASVGVVSPFRAQVYLIRRLLREMLGEAAGGVDVDTVERFQGSERDAILVSLVKSERAGDFLADERRLNVTLTRAKTKLIVFGNRGCLELNPLYRRLIEQPQTHLVV